MLVKYWNGFPERTTDYNTLTLNEFFNNVCPSNKIVSRSSSRSLIKEKLLKENYFTERRK